MEDQRITTLFASVRTLEAPTETIVSGGLERGRRRLRIVRLGEAFTAVAVVAALVGLFVALLPGPAGSGPVTTRPATSGSSPAAPARVTTTPQALLQAALDTMPRPGRTSHYAGSFSAGYVGAQFVYDDGHGAAKVSVSLDYPPAGGGLGAACDISTCTTRADGSKLAVYQGNGHPGQPGIPGKDWQVSLLRTDGVTVSVTEWNSADEKSAPLTRNLPPFTIAELTAWVGSPAWQVRISADRARSTRHLFDAIGLDPPATRPIGSVRSACAKSAERRHC